eukprot:scaffold51067_cov66-Phaeocystis_antarctica.AAC.10
MKMCTFIDLVCSVQLRVYSVQLRMPRGPRLHAHMLTRVARGLASVSDQPMLKAVQAWPANSAEQSALETPSDFSLGPAFRSGGVGSRLLYTSASPAMPADPTLSHRHPTVQGITRGQVLGACTRQLGVLSCLHRAHRYRKGSRR